MGRWRPPRAKNSPYITPEGAAILEAELKFLWKEERPKVTHDVHHAAKNGDRSENGDYIYGKKRLREIDSRVRFLSKRLEELNIVRDLPSDQNRIYFGAWVTLVDEEEQRKTYRIVGPDEFDLTSGKISIDSPLARALLKKQADDEVTITTTSGEKTYFIEKINY